MPTEKVVCPGCRREMICVGKKFTTPRKKDDAAWKKLEWLVGNGWRGYGWPTQPEMNLRQTQESLAAHDEAEQKRARKAKEDAAFLERRRVARYNARHSQAAAKRLKCDLKRQERYQEQVLADLQIQQKIED